MHSFCSGGMAQVGGGRATGLVCTFQARGHGFDPPVFPTNLGLYG